MTEHGRLRNGQELRRQDGSAMNRQAVAQRSQETERGAALSPRKWGVTGWPRLQARGASLRERVAPGPLPSGFAQTHITVVFMKIEKTMNTLLRTLRNRLRRVLTKVSQWLRAFAAWLGLRASSVSRTTGNSDRFTFVSTSVHAEPNPIGSGNDGMEA
jgi:hypothetical protein